LGAAAFGASFLLLARLAALPALLNDFNFGLPGRLADALFTSLFLLEGVFFFAADFFADIGLGLQDPYDEPAIIQTRRGSGRPLGGYLSVSGKATAAGGRHRGCLCSATTVV
jgi:hypothetical protein